MYELLEYVTASGRNPFRSWITHIKDTRAVAKLHARIRRLSLGNWGDWKSLHEGVYELREHYSPGYRVYFGVIDNRIILLLAGSTKKDQRQAIAEAKEYFRDYKKRTLS